MFFWHDGCFIKIVMFEAAINNTEQNEPDTAQDLKPENVLILDDEGIVTMALGHFLEDIGHNVESASTVRELEFRKGKTLSQIGIVLVGINGDRESALQMMEEVREHCPDADLVIMSRDGSVVSLNQALSNRVFGYLKKPVRLAELELMIKRMDEWRYRK